MTGWKTGQMPTNCVQTRTNVKFYVCMGKIRSIHIRGILTWTVSMFEERSRYFNGWQAKHCCIQWKRIITIVLLNFLYHYVQWCWSCTILPHTLFRNLFLLYKIKQWIAIHIYSNLITTLLSQPYLETAQTSSEPVINFRSCCKGHVKLPKVIAADLHTE